MVRWIYRHYLLGLIVCEAAALVVLIPYFLRLGLPFHGYLLGTTLSLMACLVPWVLLWSVSSVKLTNAAAQALNEGCDPEPLLDLSRDQLRRFDRRGRSRRSYILQALLNASAALISLGRFDEALSTLEDLAPRLPQKPGLCHLIYHVNRASVCYDLDRAAEMPACLDAAQAVLDGLTLSPAAKARYDYALQVNRTAYRLFTEGPGPEIEAGYRDHLAAAQTESQRVAFHVTLARFALARSAPEEARPHLDYAVAHGNKLYVRRKAEELLAQLPQLEAQS